MLVFQPIPVVFLAFPALEFLFCEPYKREMQMLAQDYELKKYLETQVCKILQTIEWCKQTISNEISFLLVAKPNE